MNISDLKVKLSKSLEFLKVELSQIRTGRANPSLVEQVQVEAYGTKMPLIELGSINVLDSQNLLVSTWDKSILSSVAKAIRESGLGLNPVEDAEKLRIPVPSLTEERRKEFAKMVSTKVEECKNSMRTIRQDAMKEIDKAFIDKKMGEDEKFKLREDTEKAVKDLVEQADIIGEQKKEEIMKV